MRRDIDYERDIKIDDQALDLECLEQPELMLKYIREQARLEKEEDLLKEEFELVKAKLDQEIRMNPAKFRIDKVTEGAIKSAILTDPQYISAMKAYIDAKYEAKVAKGAVEAFGQRKSMLESLVKLHGQGYFAGPNISRDLKQEREQREQRIESNMRPTRRNS